MSLLAKEAAALAGTLLTGGYMLLAVAGAVASRIPETLVVASSGPLRQHPLVVALLSVPPSGTSAVLRMLVAAVLAPVFGLLRAHWHFYRGTRIHGCKPAPTYPHRDPLFGSDLSRRLIRSSKEHRWTEEWHDIFGTCGHTYWFNAMGSWGMLTANADNMQAILSTNFDHWELLSTRQRFARTLLGERTILGANGAEWRAARNMIRPTFVRNQIADLECTDRHVEALLAHIPRDGSEFNMQKLLYEFFMDMTTDFVFGHCTNMLTTPTEKTAGFVRAFEYATREGALKLRLGRLAQLIPDAKLDGAIATYRRFISDLLSDALAAGGTKERPYVFLDEVVKTGGSPEDICAHLGAIVLGGRDTGASALTTLFRVLARRPDVVAKLRADIAHLQGRKPTWEELKELKYLHWVVKETLRLWNPTFTSMRTAIRDTILPRGGGPDGQEPIFVPKGTDIRWSVHTLHRNKDAFGPDADEFVPERWENLRTTWEYSAFGGGPRICIGQAFATTQMHYLLTRVFQTFETVQTTRKGEMRHHASSTLWLPDGCWISLR